MLILIKSLQNHFVSANNPDEMPHSWAFHLDLHYLHKYLFRVFPVYQRLTHMPASLDPDWARHFVGSKLFAKVVSKGHQRVKSCLRSDFPTR